MALVRRTMENIRRLKPRINRAKIDATTEADILPKPITFCPRTPSGVLL